ncbi:type II toxin-antitoxin system HicB family antitoxin [Selenomonas artemidis]|nr:type II toxin-antitoxin system HicB family antitoxin [Selenomonas artemidis]
MKYAYPAVFHPEEEGGFFISFPDLENCFTQGETIADGIDMASDALSLVLWHMEEEHTKIPAPSTLSSIPLEGDDFASLISADTFAYRKKNDTKSVRKNLSIPHWLDVLATERNISFSTTLQNALIRELGI